MEIDLIGLIKKRFPEARGEEIERALSKIDLTVTEEDLNPKGKIVVLPFM